SYHIIAEESITEDLVIHCVFQRSGVRTASNGRAGIDDTVRRDSTEVEDYIRENKRDSHNNGSV
ncbi:hypothetical protein, partial [Halorubrum sp. SP3]|uniref:hypothetical protein n=1 Tax=Halorubrum sp. SP3 TaxID=1537265 RepID=UPI001A7E0DFF